MDKGIEEERKRLAFLKERADYIIDTSQLLTRELKASWTKYLYRIRTIRICLSQFCHLDLNMEYRSIRIWYLMSVFYQTRIMWRACGQRPE